MYFALYFALCCKDLLNDYTRTQPTETDQRNGNCHEEALNDCPETPSTPLVQMRTVAARAFAVGWLQFQTDVEKSSRDRICMLYHFYENVDCLQLRAEKFKQEVKQEISTAPFFQFLSVSLSLKIDSFGFFQDSPGHFGDINVAVAGSSQSPEHS